jgi:hypothetical protein
MHALTIKRLIKTALLILLVVLVLVFESAYRNSLHDPAFLTGWIMLSVMVFLLLLNARKKLSFLPLGKAYSWTQLHIYGGLFLLVLFFTHTRYVLPNGVFEGLMATLFILVSLSGIIGLAISRRLPVILARQPEYVIYERLPGIRERIREEVEDRVNRAVSELSSDALAGFYAEHLYAYLSRPMNFWTHLFHRSAVYSLWDERFNAIRRYLNANENEILEQIRELTERKTDLDNQYASRSMLKYWLFFHIPLSYALLVFVILHVLLVHSFSWSAA